MWIDKLETLFKIKRTCFEHVLFLMKVDPLIFTNKYKFIYHGNFTSKLIINTHSFITIYAIPNEEIDELLHRIYYDYCKLTASLVTSQEEYEKKVGTIDKFLQRFEEYKGFRKDY